MSPQFNIYKCRKKEKEEPVMFYRFHALLKESVTDVQMVIMQLYKINCFMIRLKMFSEKI
jgi:hypothetical protein